MNAQITLSVMVLTLHPLIYYIMKFFFFTEGLKNQACYIYITPIYFNKGIRFVRSYGAKLSPWNRDWNTAGAKRISIGSFHSLCNQLISYFQHRPFSHKFPEVALSDGGESRENYEYQGQEIQDRKALWII